jgi:VWFA-related protein
MRLRCSPLRIFVFLAIGWACASQIFVRGQNLPGQSEDVVRVNTVLVQTDVMVFDKQGGFVDGLKRDEFVLKIDGKPRSISFFERVTAGSRNEEAQLAAARGLVITGGASASAGPVPLDRGRTVFFFIDDLHLSVSSVNLTRVLVSGFIDHQMGQNDEAVVTSTSGQIGFVQQLTDNKAVLRAAVERLKPRSYMVRDAERPPMSEYQALLIERNDTDVSDFFVDELLKENPMLPRATAEQMVQGRASQLLHLAASVTTNTLASLESLVKTSALLPGRKLVFLVSDGFFLDSRNSDAYERVRQIASAAAASGVIIYSIDARGLVTSVTDASSSSAGDPSGRLQRSGSGELLASQDALNALASDTGGRVFFNSNMLSAAVATALKESSVYYLLAWRPETEEQRNPKYRRIEVSVIGRPELVVRFRQGFGDARGADSEARSKPKTKEITPIQTSPVAELRAALRSPYPKSDLPISVSVNFLDLPQRGSMLSTSLKISTGSIVFETEGSTVAASIDLAGVIFDDQGKPVSSFDKRLTIKPNSSDPKTPPPESVFYHNYSAIKPGLYQVRVAAVEEKQSRAGSAAQWIEIPDLTLKTLTLSTLIVGERRSATEAQQAGPTQNSVAAPGPFSQISLSVDHHFARSSHLRFLTFIYNAAGGAAKASNHVPSDRDSRATTSSGSSLVENSSNGSATAPDLAVQVQVFRDNEPVITEPLHKIQIEGVSDLTRVPYAAELAMEDLQPGRYVLQVTIIDRLAKTSASQHYNFDIQ